jgi:hypothetical protein
MVYLFVLLHQLFETHDPRNIRHTLKYFGLSFCQRNASPRSRRESARHRRVIDIALHLRLNQRVQRHWLPRRSKKQHCVRGTWQQICFLRIYFAFDWFSKEGEWVLRWMNFFVFLLHLFMTLRIYHRRCSKINKTGQWIMHGTGWGLRIWSPSLNHRPNHPLVSNSMGWCQ